MAYRIGRCLLSKILRDAGMTQTELAEQLNVTRQQVNKWATNRQGMSLETAKKIVVILRIRCIDDLYEWIPSHD